MNPWDILGWMLVGWIGGMILVRFLIILVDIYEYATKFAEDFYRHLKTYRTPPEEGQIWNRGREHNSLQVRGVYPTHIAVRAGSTVSWGMKSDEWKKMVRQPRTYLIRGKRS